MPKKAPKLRARELMPAHVRAAPIVAAAAEFDHDDPRARYQERRPARPAPSDADFAVLALMPAPGIEPRIVQRDLIAVDLQPLDADSEFARIDVVEAGMGGNEREGLQADDLAAQGQHERQLARGEPERFDA